MRKHKKNQRVHLNAERRRAKRAKRANRAKRAQAVTSASSADDPRYQGTFHDIPSEAQNIVEAFDLLGEHGILLATFVDDDGERRTGMCAVDWERLRRGECEPFHSADKEQALLDGVAKVWEQIGERPVSIINSVDQREIERILSMEGNLGPELPGRIKVGAAQAPAYRTYEVIRRRLGSAESDVFTIDSSFFPTVDGAVAMVVFDSGYDERLLTDLVTAADSGLVHVHDCGPSDTPSAPLPTSRDGFQITVAVSTITADRGETPADLREWKITDLFAEADRIARIAPQPAGTLDVRALRTLSDS